LRGSYFIKAIENCFPVFAWPDVGTWGVGRMFDSCANPRPVVQVVEHQAFMREARVQTQKARPTLRVLIITEEKVLPL